MNIKKMMMKPGLFLVAILVLVAACSVGNDPETVAENFLQAIQEGNYDEAKRYATEESEEQLDMFHEIPSPNEGRPFHIVEVNRTTDTTAIASYRWEDDEERILDLVRRGGNWKVQFDKLQEIDLEDLFDHPETLEEDELPAPPADEDPQVDTPAVGAN